jgi:hypothetical protein
VITQLKEWAIEKRTILQCVQQCNVIREARSKAKSQQGWTHYDTLLNTERAKLVQLRTSHSENNLTTINQLRTNSEIVPDQLRNALRYSDLSNDKKTQLFYEIRIHEIGEASKKFESDSLKKDKQEEEDPPLPPPPPPPLPFELISKPRAEKRSSTPDDILPPPPPPPPPLEDEDEDEFSVDGSRTLPDFFPPPPSFPPPPFDDSSYTHSVERPLPQFEMPPPPPPKSFGSSEKGRFHTVDISRLPRVSSSTGQRDEGSPTLPNFFPPTLDDSSYRPRMEGQLPRFDISPPPPPPPTSLRSSEKRGSHTVDTSRLPQVSSSTVQEKPLTPYSPQKVSPTQFTILVPMTSSSIAENARQLTDAFITLKGAAGFNSGFQVHLKPTTGGNWQIIINATGTPGAKIERADIRKCSCTKSTGCSTNLEHTYKFATGPFCKELSTKIARYNMFAIFSTSEHRNLLLVPDTTKFHVQPQNYPHLFKLDEGQLQTVFSATLEVYNQLKTQFTDYRSDTIEFHVGRDGSQTEGILHVRFIGLPDSIKKLSNQPPISSSTSPISSFPSLRPTTSTTTFSSSASPLSTAKPKDVVPFSYGGVSALKEKQKDHLIKLLQLANYGQWHHLQTHTGHPDSSFDWWMFPTNLFSTQYGNLYQVSSQDIESLKKDAAFMASYRAGIILVAKSWGWDLETNRDVTNTWQKWSDYQARLGKMLHSLQLFGQKDLHDRLVTFLHRQKISDTLSPKIKPYLIPIQSTSTTAFSSSSSSSFSSPLSTSRDPDVWGPKGEEWIAGPKGVNQYLCGGISACTPLAVCFASTAAEAYRNGTEGTPGEIFEILQNFRDDRHKSKRYKDGGNNLVDEAIDAVNDISKEVLSEGRAALSVPKIFKRQLQERESWVCIGQNPVHGLRDFRPTPEKKNWMQIIHGMKPGEGAVIQFAGYTISCRRLANCWEFFDSHRGRDLAKAKGFTDQILPEGAYIKRCSTIQSALGYLNSLFQTGPQREVRVGDYQGELANAIQITLIG